MATYLIASLPSDPISLELIEIMQNNDLFYRISTNVPLMNYALYSAGGGLNHSLAVAMGFSEELQMGQEERSLVAALTNISPPKIKVEVDLDDVFLSRECVVKEENAVSKSFQSNDSNHSLQISPEAVQPVEPIVALENTSNNVGQAEDDLVDVHHAGQGKSWGQSNEDEKEDKERMYESEEEEDEEDLTEEKEGEEDSDYELEGIEEDELENEESDSDKSRDVDFDKDCEKGQKARSSKQKRRYRTPLFACLVKNCSSAFKMMKQLVEHTKSHTGKQEFFCNVCKTEFPSKDSALAHIRRRENRKCCGCEKKFKYSKDLITHLRCHSGEKPFVCESCGQGFAQKSTLKTHMLTHTGEKRFSCKTCKRSFAQKHGLETHERTHSGDKPYKCEHCDYRCARTNTLKVHERTHTGEKSYACGHCEKTFAHSHNLKRHVVIHSNEKPFECEHCGMRFNIKHNLTTHIRVHTGEKPYGCKECDRKFTQSSSLKDHMKRWHKS